MLPPRVGWVTSWQSPISLIIFILDLGPSYTDKLLEFRWVQIAHLS